MTERLEGVAFYGVEVGGLGGVLDLLVGVRSNGFTCSSTWSARFWPTVFWSLYARCLVLLVC